MVLPLLLGKINVLPAFLLALVFLGTHSHVVLEVAVERCAAAESRLFGYLGQRYGGLPADERCGVLNAHAVDVLAERDAHSAVDGYVDVVAVGVQQLHQVYNLQVRAQEQPLLLHQQFYALAQFRCGVVFYLSRFWLLFLALKVCYAELLSIAYEADAEQHNGEQRRRDGQQPHGFYEQLSADDVEDERGCRGDDEGRQHVVERRECLILGVGIGVVHHLIIFAYVDAPVEEYRQDENGKQGPAGVVGVGLSGGQTHQSFALVVIKVAIDELLGLFGRHDGIEQPHIDTPSKCRQQDNGPFLVVLAADGQRADVEVVDRIDRQVGRAVEGVGERNDGRVMVEKDAVAEVEHRGRQHENQQKCVGLVKLLFLPVDRRAAVGA